MPRELTPAYYRRVARSVGVPEFWVDDAAQEMAVEAWRSGKDGAGLARRRAIDAVRKYGSHTRYGSVRETETLGVVSLPVWDSYMGLLRLDIRRAARGLTYKQRQALRRRMAGLPMSDTDSTHASAARRRLRALLAA